MEGMGAEGRVNRPIRWPVTVWGIDVRTELREKAVRRANRMEWME